MNRTWAEVSCEIPADMVDLVADYLVEVTGNGVSIDNLELDTFSLDTVEESSVKTVRAYFTPGEELDAQIAELAQFLHENAPAFGAGSIPPPRVAMIGEEDWATGWRQHFAPTRIGSHLVIKPTWEPFDSAPGDLVIELDPGMAFGTGTHPTTRLCLEALEEIAASLGAAPLEVLDVGTGSGILAIAAAKLGARRVVGTDIDPDAVVVAAENCAMNGVADAVELVTTPLEAIPGSFTVTLANILAEDLVRMAAELATTVAPGGFLVLSGILCEREEYVINGFVPTGLSFQSARHGGEWSCLVYRRGA
ncbi:50S ribosomal protein L11 methyltransferase [Geobacter pickeringii]|uniref:Ribosomal protein L11 methyltransferase n=1 Tax=Geobacter pickeringii TaxID=345632 RepID=A0A0B5BCX8_9BACT|nr:50S ribosomal protein L11 methyltransferase [Geobacter pickeringii]AJE04583.1 ribosomal protein L11 methyltransferase [Geobacter pickeringii]